MMLALIRRYLHARGYLVLHAREVEATAQDLTAVAEALAHVNASGGASPGVRRRVRTSREKIAAAGAHLYRAIRP